MNLLLTILLACTMLLICGWVSAFSLHHRRGRAFYAAMQSNTRSALKLQGRDSTGAFRVHIEPAPEPFQRLIAIYKPPTPWNPLTMLYSLISRRAGRWVVQAKLTNAPTAELWWYRGEIPAYASSRDARHALWIQRRLDITGAAYAVKGDNTRALEHSFADIQTRFGPTMHHLYIQASEVPEVEASLYATGLNAEDIPALITTLRAVGRAALL